MSIDPLKMIQQAIPTQVSSAGARQPAAGGKSFQETLNQLESKENSAIPTPEAAQLAARLAQFHMLQSLFLTDDETDDGESDSLPTLNWNSFAAPAPQASQKADKLYRNLQSSLPIPGEHSREGIDRLINRISKQVSLAPDLIRSVVATESDFRPDAISPVGAQGLMQLMPDTAKEMGVQNSFDPQQNLLAGSQYLKQLLDKYDGDLDHALAAYNWGPGNVDRHGLEQMPQETREYLAKVKAGMTGPKG